MKRTVLWLGLLLCVYALWRARGVAGDAIGRMGFITWVVVALLLAAGWWLAVMAWRRYVQAYVGQALAWRVAIRQIGLLLVGKYVPGGVFGFLARLYDAPTAPRERLFWAGSAEQATGVAMPIALGGALYLTGRQENPVWLCSVLLLPVLAITGLRLLHHFASGLPCLRSHVAGSQAPAWRHLYAAVSLQLIQQAVWAALLAVLVHTLFGINGYAALGIAGGFCLAIAAGMLAVFAPGGIGVREAALIGLASPWLGTTQAIFLSALLRILSSVMDVGAGVMAALSGRKQINRESGS